jgi:flavodoxin I
LCLCLKTGNTQDCADKIYNAIGSEFAAEPVDIDSIEAGALAETFAQHEALIVGTPTWNTGADSQRSGTGWDDLYYKQLPSLQNELANKKVAVFGLGDQVSYSENYGDATGELYSVFANLGCNMVPYAATSTDGYEHTASKSILPGNTDGSLFCGLLLDQINQEDYTDERITAWVMQLLSNGFAEQGDAVNGERSAAAPKVTAATATAASSKKIVDADLLEQGSADLDESIAFSSIGGGTFTPHTNPRTGQTMWTSPDGRQSYLTPPSLSSSSTTTMTTTLRP